MDRLSPIVDFINTHYEKNITLKDMAMMCFLCPAYFIREFKKKYNVSPYQYLISRRLDEAQHLLHQKEISIKQICTKVGYEDVSSFSKLFKRRFGISPENYRQTL
jgi:AraC-like DNA-binding protein